MIELSLMNMNNNFESNDLDYSLANWVTTISLRYVGLELLHESFTNLFYATHNKTGSLVQRLPMVQSLYY